MNFYLFLIPFLLLSVGAVGAPLNLRCFNADLRTASLDINPQGLRIQSRFLVEGNSELEQYYVDTLELKTSSDLTINRVMLSVPAEDVRCVRPQRGVHICRGISSSAVLEVAGNYTKDNTLVALNGQTRVNARLLSVSTKQTPDLTSDVARDNLQLEARIEITFLDGIKMTLLWAPYFTADGDVTRSSYCVGL